MYIIQVNDVGCRSFEPSRSINCKWTIFWCCATIAFRELYMYATLWYPAFALVVISFAEFSCFFKINFVFHCVRYMHIKLEMYIFFYFDTCTVNFYYSVL